MSVRAASFIVDGSRHAVGDCHGLLQSREPLPVHRDVEHRRHPPLSAEQARFARAIAFFRSDLDSAGFIASEARRNSGRLQGKTLPGFG